MNPWLAIALWLIPGLPLLAAAGIAFCGRDRRRLAAGLALGALGGSFLLAVAAAGGVTWGSEGGPSRYTFNFPWADFGGTALWLGWVWDPLAAGMAVMVSGISLLIFIFSLGYMAKDPNYTRFFGFMALFAGAMLGVVLANSLLFLFIFWELVGLSSYLLIGFWFQRPSAAAAAKKAFLTTRIGDMGLLLGMLWLYHQSGTLLFYDRGRGCLEGPALAAWLNLAAGGGLAATAIGLLIFCGAAGKSGQVPLHVWLPDAMEGPTPVSALIHAATMVAAGVFLMARVYPLLTEPALTAIAWVGAITAIFAALIAVAQTDIKKVLAYSTISQLGYMMLGLGVGGVAVGMFHLLTHAVFKALLFLGAGSIIHGCHEEQDIRRLGGLRRRLPITFATYAIGLAALTGVPVFFAGFWSKDEILRQAWEWPISTGPFWLGLAGAFLTAFYMTRQAVYIFWGPYRGAKHAPHASAGPRPHLTRSQIEPHESPSLMTWPLRILAGAAMVVGLIGTPVWPKFQSFLTGAKLEVHWWALFEPEGLRLMGLATAVVAAGFWAGWRLYGRKPALQPDQADPLEGLVPTLFEFMRQNGRVDELYARTVLRANTACAAACDWLDRVVWGNLVLAVAYLVLGLGWLDRFCDEWLVNRGFDAGCGQVRRSGTFMARLQNGQVQDYLGGLALALALMVLALAWGGLPW